MQIALLKHRSKLDEPRVARLYRAAHSVITGKPVVPATGLTCSTRTVGDIIWVVIFTDVETGLFVQLSRQVEVPDSFLLTFGQKYCEESRDAARSSQLTKIWT